jgi:twitching motility two-component system response regulator PilH
MAKVLVVDDAKEVIDFIEGVLRTAGHEVVGFQDARDLEARIETRRPDLVLLDVVLPDRNGYQVLRALRRAEGTRRLPVVLVSSKREPTDVEWGMLQGATDYLTKPFTAEGLLTLVARHA